MSLCPHSIPAREDLGQPAVHSGVGGLAAGTTLTHGDSGESQSSGEGQSDLRTVGIVGTGRSDPHVDVNLTCEPDQCCPIPVVCTHKWKK